MQSVYEIQMPAIEAGAEKGVALVPDGVSEMPSQVEAAVPEIAAALADATGVPELTIEDAAHDLTASAVSPGKSEDAPETSETTAFAGAPAPAEPEPARRKRPRRKSNRKAAPRKRRAKKA